MVSALYRPGPQKNIPAYINGRFSKEPINYIDEKPRNNEWGDFSTNIALVLAKWLKKNPMDLAKSISKNIN